MFNTNPWLAYYSTSNRIKSTYVQGFLDICGNIILRNGGFSLPNGDVSMNGNLYVGLDASFNRNVFINTPYNFKNKSINQLDGSYNINIASAVGTFPNYGTTQNGNRLINIGSGNFNLVAKGLNDSIAIGNTITTATNPTGFGIIGIGNNIFPALTSGFQNIGIGNTIATSMTIGHNNVFIGNGVATSTTSTGNTVAIGTAAGKTNTTGINNTYLGAFTDATVGTYNNSTALGYGATITSSNQIKLGTSNESVDISGNLNVSGIANMLGYIGMKVIGCNYTGSATVNSNTNNFLWTFGGTANFNTEVFNEGISIDATLKIPVAPVNGYYLIGVNLGCTNKTGFNVLVNDSTNIGGGYALFGGTGTGNIGITTLMLAKMNATDKIYVRTVITINGGGRVYLHANTTNYCGNFFMYLLYTF